jgi:hypothetical protein
MYRKRSNNEIKKKNINVNEGREIKKKEGKK